MSEQISYYEKDLIECLERLKKIYEEINQELNSNNNIKIKSDSFEKGFQLISKGESLCNQMKIEISLDSQLSNIYKSKINEYSNSFSSYKKKLKKFQEQNIYDKNNSFIFDTKQNNGGLIQNEEYAYSGNQKLQEVKRVLASTEDTSNKIISNMEYQTNQMKSVNVKIQSMNDNLDSSSNILGSMQNILRKNKKIIYIFGIILLAILILVISMKIIFRK